MTATVAASFDATLPPLQDLQATSLWTFVQLKTPRFTPDAALQVVKDLTIEPGEEPKRLAKRVRRALQERGVALPHTAALEAASRLLGHSSWHRAEPKYTLRLIPTSAERDEIFPNWNVLSPRLRRWCDIARKAMEAKVLEMRFAPELVMVTTPAMRTAEDGVESIVALPVVALRPEEEAAEAWLQGANVAFEALRRHVEEPGHAVLDGVAVLQLCSAPENASQADGARSTLSAADVCNAELVLVQEDKEGAPGTDYEVARGDEMACWAQLDMLLRDRGDTDLRLDGSAWRAGDARFVWALSVLRPAAVAPEVLVSPLTQQESERLFRRYRLARRIFGGQVRHHEVAKQLQYLKDPAESYRVNLRWLQGELEKAGYSWDSFCKENGGAQQEMAEELPLEFILLLSERLGLETPNRMFALPSRSELIPLNNSSVLRALMPRVDAVRYRSSVQVSEEVRAELHKAILHFNTVVMLQKLPASGTLPVEAGPVPHVALCSECDTFLEKLRELGLETRVGVVAHLSSMKEHVDSLPEDMWSHAFGHAMFLDVDVVKNRAAPN